MAPTLTPPSRLPSMMYLLIGGGVLAGLAGLIVGAAIWFETRPEPLPWAEDNFYGGHWPDDVIR